ncbi:hypothetical protein K2Q16_04575 [Patescibacteria group bacterium]|nr:hypothetical protein [Patescibacteria group bacterium]
MLIRYITQLRKSSKAVRDRHAFYLAASVTGVVGLLWLVTLPMTLEKSPTSLAENASSSRPVGSFLSRAREQAAQLVHSFKEQTGSASSSVQVVVDGELAASSRQIITLTPEELAAIRASTSIPYNPPATSTPRVVRIATTSAAVGVFATTSTSTSP